VPYLTATAGWLCHSAPKPRAVGVLTEWTDSQALDILQVGLPRTFVSLVGIIDVTKLCAPTRTQHATFHYLPRNKMQHSALTMQQIHSSRGTTTSDVQRALVMGQRTCYHVALRNGDMQHATFIVHRGTSSVARATDDVPHATCHGQRATDNIQHAGSCNTFTADSVQRTARSTHATWQARGAELRLRESAQPCVQVLRGRRRRTPPC
jgi:hypothetical protein